MFVIGQDTTAAWAHKDARQGFEVAHLVTRNGTRVATGCTTAVQDGVAWTVQYELELDDAYLTRRAFVAARSATGSKSVELTSDGGGHWQVDGRPAPALDHCLDVDLELSAFTNALPARRLALKVGERADAPAAFVRAADLRVERLEQTYERLADQGQHTLFAYRAPSFQFSCTLVYDADGLVHDYPGIARRVY